MTNVYEKIQHVQQHVDRIRKEGDLELGGKKTKFLAIDDVLTAMKEKIDEQKLVILPHEVSTHTHIFEAQATPALTPMPDGPSALKALEKWSGRLAKTQIREKVTYDWIIVDTENPDSQVVVRVGGEAMDSQDKAMQKAITSAYKSMLIKTFMLRTGEPELEDEQRVDQGEDEPKQNRGQQMTERAGSPTAAAPARIAPTATVMDDDSDAGGAPAVKKAIRDLCKQHGIPLGDLKAFGGKVMETVDGDGNVTEVPYDKWFGSVRDLKKVQKALADDAVRTETLAQIHGATS